MPNPNSPTSYPDVNSVLEYFAQRVRQSLGHHFVGFYCVGSLALGDFDQTRSDIDFVVVANTGLDEGAVLDFRAIHAKFAATESNWAKKTEAIYVSESALRESRPPGEFPQMEKRRTLELAPLEWDWVFHRWTLRERCLAVVGADARPLVPPIDPDDMKSAAVAMAGDWLELANNDPTWIAWLSEPRHFSFVIQTLSRMLYSISTGTVTSKVQAMRWAVENLDEQWRRLLRKAGTLGHTAEMEEGELEDAVDLVSYTIDRGRQ